MTHEEQLERLIVAANALIRTAALETRNDAPAAQWRTLSILRASGPLRLGELARLSRVTQPGVTRLVAQFAEAGLVTREADAADSRATVVAITPAGLEAVDSWRNQLVSAIAPRFADLDDDQWQALGAATTIIENRIDAPAVAR